LELSFGVVGVHMRYSTYLVVMGKYDEALAEAQIARNLDLVSPALERNVARPLYFMRRYDEALMHYKESLDFDPNSLTTHEYIGLVYSAKGMRNEAITELETARNAIKDNVWYAGIFGYMYVLGGRLSDVCVILDRLLQDSAHDSRPAVAIAVLY